MLTVSPILVISGDRDHRAKLVECLSKCGLRSISCDSIASAKLMAHRLQFSAVLFEDAWPEEDPCVVIEEIGRPGGNLPVVIASRHDDWDSYLRALAAGAFDYVGFPPNPGELERAIWAALGESKQLEEVAALPAA